MFKILLIVLSTITAFSANAMMECRAECEYSRSYITVGPVSSYNKKGCYPEPVYNGNSCPSSSSLEVLNCDRPWDDFGSYKVTWQCVDTLQSGNMWEFKATSSQQAVQIQEQTCKNLEATGNYNWVKLGKLECR